MEKIAFSYFIKDNPLAKERHHFLMHSLLLLSKKYDVTIIIKERDDQSLTID
jgi:hypothetical protein